MSQAELNRASSALSAKLWWAVPAAALLLLTALSMFLGTEQDPLDLGTSYDASEVGYRAAYLLLEELKFPVARSRQPTGGAARLVLNPQLEEREVPALEQWVREGGVLVLAVELAADKRSRTLKELLEEPELKDSLRPKSHGKPVLAEGSAKLAEVLGLRLELKELEPDPGDEPATGEGISTFHGGSLQVTAREPADRVLATAGDEPLVSVHRHGAGEVWLLNRPRFLSNEYLPKADNAVLFCRLMREALANREGPVAFDEFVHGLRDRPGLFALLGRPPALWMTLQCVLATAIVLWHFAPRFGSLRPVPPPARRSKEEFLDAMAALLARKGDAADAYRAARNDLAAEIERELGLPPGASAEDVAREAGRRLPVNRALLLHVLQTENPPAGGGPAGLLKLMNELETIHDEFFARSRAR